MDMKKIYSMLTIAIVGLSAMMMTSCTEDQEIGMSLEGTWVGNMYVYHEWSGQSYKATESEITFNSDPFRTTKGDGYWVDYYAGGSYIANHIRWEVHDRIIRVWFREDGGYEEISDFRINNSRFEGYIYDNDGNPLKFELRKVYNRNYNNYNWGGSYWYDDYYYAPAYSPAKGKVAATDSIANEKKNEIPTRYILAKDPE